MEIRPATSADLERLTDIDGTIESLRYLHLDRSGEGMAVQWKLDERPLREKRIERNAMVDETIFAFKQIVSGVDEGLALVAEHDDALVASAVARPNVSSGTMQLLDLRVDFDFRRQGLGTALMYQIIGEARNAKLRAVAVTMLTNNVPGSQFLLKAGFDLAGVDAQLNSNHDLVKEAVSLFWYASLD
jgi:GNAT superfamily N-acetyltransferase